MILVLSSALCVVHNSITTGVDVSAPVDTTEWTCAAEKAGAGWAVISAWRPNGTVDWDAAGSFNAASVSQFPTNVDMYMKPCFGDDPYGQVTELTRDLASLPYKFLWFKVTETTGPADACTWGADPEENCKYVADLLDAATGFGTGAGVHSSRTAWNRIVGSNCSAALTTYAPLWWDAVADNATATSCAEFAAAPDMHFGGWKSAFALRSASSPSAALAACGIDASAGMDTTCGAGI